MPDPSTADRYKSKIEEKQSENAFYQSFIDRYKKQLEGLSSTDPLYISAQQQIKSYQQKQQDNTSVITELQKNYDNTITTNRLREIINSDESKKARQTATENLDTAKKSRTDAENNFYAADKAYQAAVEAGKPQSELDTLLQQKNAAAVDVKQKRASENDASKVVATIKKDQLDAYAALGDPEKANAFLKSREQTALQGTSLPKGGLPETVPYGPVSESTRQALSTSNEQVFDTQTGKYISAKDMVPGDPLRYNLDRTVADQAKAIEISTTGLKSIDATTEGKVTTALQAQAEYEDSIKTDPTYVSLQSDITSNKNDISVLTASVDSKTKLQSWYNDHPGETLTPEEASTLGIHPDDIQIPSDQIAHQIDITHTALQTNTDQLSALDAQNKQYDQQIKDSQIATNKTIDGYKKSGDADKAKLISDNAQVYQSTRDINPDEARNAYVNFQQSSDAERIAEVKFQNTRNKAIANCQANGGTSCEDPKSWSTFDQYDVTLAATNVNAAKSDVQKSASNLSAIANSPKGIAALKASGLSDAEITALSTQVKTQSDSSKSKIDNGLTASTLDPSVTARKTSTGFESINGGAPFYMQFPTLDSITDFHIKNGYSPYGARGKDDIARDGVHFNIYSLTPPTAQAQASSDGSIIRNILTGNGSDLLGSFTIYPSQNTDYGFSHQHKYGTGAIGGIADQINGVLGFIDNAEGILNMATAGLNNIEAGQEQASAQKINRKVDAMDFYQETSKLDLSLQFNLFTKNNFLKDVFRPLMFLTALSYPKRTMGGEWKQDLQNNYQAIDKLSKQNGVAGTLANTMKGLIDNIPKGAQNGANSVVNYMDQADKYLASTGGIGPFRYYIYKRPEYMTVRHASGLFYFPLAYIESVTYTFKGPWYNAEGKPFNESPPGNLQTAIEARIVEGAKLSKYDPTLSQRIGDAFGTEASKERRRTLEEKNAAEKAKADAQEKEKLAQQSAASNTFIKSLDKLNYAYPSHAECTIKIRNATLFFRDDWMDLYNGASDPNKLVSVSVKQTDPRGMAMRPDGQLYPIPGMNIKDIGSTKNTSNNNVKPTGAVDAKDNASASATAEAQANPSSGIPIEEQIVQANADVAKKQEMVNDQLLLQEALHAPDAEANIRTELSQKLNLRPDQITNNMVNNQLHNEIGKNNADLIASRQSLQSSKTNLRNLEVKQRQQVAGGN